MSLLSPDIRIALTPEWVAVGTSRLYREARVEEGSDALYTLAELLGSLKLKGRARVVLSHEMARVWLLPAPPVRLKTDEMKGWISAYLARHFGIATDGWQLAWQPAPPGQPVFAGAIDVGWLAAMNQVLKDKGVKPVAVEPWLVTVSHRLRNKLGKGAAWLALAEPGRITLARFEGGAFRGLRSSRIVDDPAETLAAMVGRESLLANIDDHSPIMLEAVQVQANWRDKSGLDVRQPNPMQSGLASMM